ncbi:MAG: bifunctional 3-(3-hydroxy-phenyl)propionate/3-hydroxycinnamic acid hydroxylase [Rhodospirillaceae bacterium]|nr:MAG: bifunctional 3-(3-hydroxy-phenyl)propionate/3-hydroxycinnamic acid hydroxylase [Rhodospirillaceae bacterium]
MPDGGRAHAVAVIGLGPVGAVAANLLAKDGIDTIAIEASRTIWDTPRAIGMDHEVLRILQSIGVADDLQPYCEPYRPTQYHSACGEVLRQFDSLPEPYPLAWPPNLTFVQPELEKALRAACTAHPTLRLRLGQPVRRIERTNHGTWLIVIDDNGEAETIEATYVLACDGASSFVRTALGISMEDLSFDEPWLVVDVLLNDDVELPELNIQFCDPARPMTFVRGPNRLRRWEIMLNPGDDPVAMTEEKNLWLLLARWLKPDQARIWRAATYRFHALVANEWYRENVFLVGDAAHQSPPFMAQGMSQGMRDAANIAWKLRAVIDGGATPNILRTYELERRPNVRAVIETTKNLGQIICERNSLRAAERNKRMRAEMVAGTGRQIRQNLLPPLENGLLMKSAGAGETAPQPWLRVDGKAVRSDDVTGIGFHLWLRVGTTINSKVKALAAKLGVGIFVLDSVESESSVVEVNGIFQDWLAARGACAALVRPDHIVYGTAGSENQIMDMHQSLATDLGLLSLAE